MPSNTRANLIRTRFASQVALPTLYENDGQSVPTTMTGTTAWCELFVRDGESEQNELTQAGREFTVGVVIVNIYTALGIGDSLARGHAETVKAAFKNYDLADGTSFSVPSITPVGESGGWFQVSVSCPWRSHE